MREGTRLLFAAAALLASQGAFADGPVMRSLQGAAVAPLGASLEAQSMSAGASFSGNLGSGAVNGATGSSSAGAPRLNVPGAGRTASLTKAPPPPLSEKEEKTLKLVRGAGVAAAAVGLGMFAFAIATAATGPIGWAAALVFFGGLGAYLAHRRLKGENDFGPK